MSKPLSCRQIAFVLGLIMATLSLISFIQAGGNLNAIKADILGASESKPLFFTEGNISQFMLPSTNPSKPDEPVTLEVKKEEVEF